VGLYLLTVLIQYFHLLHQLLVALVLVVELETLEEAAAGLAGTEEPGDQELPVKVLLAGTVVLVGIKLVAVAVPEGLVK
jgi:hypothetical protein